MKAFLTLQHGSKNIGTLHLELYDSSVPKTVKNFATLLQRKERGYLGCSFHRIIAGFMAQGGDFTRGDGTGGESIYGPSFEDENFIHKHSRAGSLSMANSGRNTNGSQFFITFRPTPHLDGKHVVFGHVDLTKSADALDALQSVKTGASDRPVQPVTILDCGVEGAAAENEQVVEDEAEIDLEEEEEEDEQKLQEDAVPEEEEEEEDDSVPLNKAEALKKRLRKLKQKMNQARALNQQAVKQEGERLNQQDAEKRRQYMKDKKAKKAEFEAKNARALETAKAFGVDGKAIVQQAGESLQKAHARAEKEELNQFSARDYHNPEGQHRNYTRSIKSLPRNSSAAETSVASTATFDPLQNQVDPDQEREGARRLASEMHRRIEKQKKKALKKRTSDEDAAGHINKRNKLFNEKISRNYDQHTAEIRQNLERGTAL